VQSVVKALIVMIWINCVWGFIWSNASHT